MRDALGPVAQALSEARQRPLGKPFFSDPRYRTSDFDAARFFELQGEVAHVGAVDAGNQELFGGASASLQFVRAYANVFAKRNRIHQERHEFLCLTQCTDGAVFESRLFPLRGGLLQEEGRLLIRGADVQDADERSKAAQIGALSRRFAEWALCANMLEQFDDILLVKDGTLQTSVAREGFYAKRARERSRKNRQLAALAKTSTLLTTTGHSVAHAVTALAPQGAWAYQWVAQSAHPDHPADIAMAKLHPQSERIFRVEAQSGQNIAWASLCENASDPAFLGYTYALVDADHGARVTNAEAASFRGLVAVALGKNAQELSRDTDAHGWLSKL